MNKTVLLAATAVLSLAAGSALAGSHPSVAVKTTHVVPIHSPGRMLYNQNSNFGNSLTSDNFTSGALGTAYNSTGADDFVVPAGKTWKIRAVDVTGVYANCTTGVNCGPATSETITFYNDNNGAPGTVIGTPQTVNCTDSSGSFACAISVVKLTGGANGTTYWLGFAANMNYGSAREWFWTENTTINGNQGEWENPGGGLKMCATWGSNETCFGTASDYAFALKGRSR